MSCDVIAVQEFPKQEAGWKIIAGNKFHGIVHLNYGMYRGVGVLYRSDCFEAQLHKRNMGATTPHPNTAEGGNRVLAPPEQRAEGGSSQVPVRIFASQTERGAPTVVLGDFNVQLTWREADSGVVPGVITAKWASLRQGMMEEGLQQAVPGVEQMHTATFHSRKRTVSSTQIDGAFVSGLETAEIVVKVDSRHEVGH